MRAFDVRATRVRDASAVVCFVPCMQRNNRFLLMESKRASKSGPHASPTSRRKQSPWTSSARRPLRSRPSPLGDLPLNHRTAWCFHSTPPPALARQRGGPARSGSARGRARVRAKRAVRSTVGPRQSSVAHSLSTGRRALYRLRRGGRGIAVYLLLNVTRPQRGSSSHRRRAQRPPRAQWIPPNPHHPRVSTPCMHPKNGVGTHQFVAHIPMRGIAPSSPSRCHEVRGGSNELVRILGADPPPESARNSAEFPIPTPPKSDRCAWPAT
eukprot:gene14568-biopygen14193